MNMRIVIVIGILFLSISSHAYWVIGCQGPDNVEMYFGQGSEEHHIEPHLSIKTPRAHRTFKGLQQVHTKVAQNGILSVEAGYGDFFNVVVFSLPAIPRYDVPFFMTVHVELYWAAKTSYSMRCSARNTDIAFLTYP